MASPKTTWSGFIELGLITIPVTVAKATGEPEKVSDVVKEIDYDSDKKTFDRIDRSERNVRTGQAVTHKRRAVLMQADDWRLFDDEEWAEIEQHTKTPTLKVSDVQPLRRLPMLYTQATYYVRHDPNSKIQPVALANLIAAMTVKKLALVCKWGSTHRQKLIVISAEAGVLVMRQIPFLTEVRVASKMERAHMAIKVDPKLVGKFSELLDEFSSEKFDYGSYFDEGLVRRKAAVDRVLAGEEIQEPEPEQDMVDIFDALEKAVADATREKQHV